jgi:uncharacterized membrane protein
MTWFPAIPGWDGIHPALVHFPIALLLAAPLLLVVSLFAKRSWGAWAGAAWVVMVLGAAAAWLAVGSGHAAGQLVDKTDAMARAIGRHEALGILTRNLFTALALLFAAILLLPAMIRKPIPAPFRITLHSLFLALYLGGTTVLVHAANQGGHLVHERGVRSMVGSSVTPPPPPAELAKPTGEHAGS